MATYQHNLDLAQKYIQRFKNNGVQHFINGEVLDSISGETFATLNPGSGEEICQVASGDSRDIDIACKAAADAFPAWRDMPANKRRQILLNVADAIEAHKEELGVLESLDCGQAIRFMGKTAIRGAANFRFFADQIPTARDGQALQMDEHFNYTSRQAIGPVGVITPWNVPFMLSTWKIAPALAAGCTVVHKSAEWSPVTAQRLAEICFAAGLPKGVLNLVHGLGETAGKSLTEHEAIKAVAFVGESRTGSMIMSQSAPTLKRIHLELGGKNPVIVFEDADIERAVDAAVFMIYSLNGQRCTSSSRLLVQDSIYADFTARVAKRCAKLKVGDALDPATEVGPMIHAEHYQKVQSYFDIAPKEGATIAAGGKTAEVKGLENGNFVCPTLFTQANNKMTVAQEEIFGPVLTAIPFKDEADALAIANDTEYGLTGYIWTNDVGRAHRVADKLEAGMIWINSQNVRHLPAPFGGVKASGIGRDGGDYSFEFYMETKNVCVAFGEHAIPKLGVS